MKIPQMPLSLFEEVRKKGAEGSDYLLKFISSQPRPVDDKGRYSHWDKVQYRPVPDGYDSELEYWHSLKWARHNAKRNTVFKCKDGQPFSYVEFDKLSELKDWVIANASGNMDSPISVKNDKAKNTFLISSIIEEAISSSKMEGASTTRRVAKDMLRTGRQPKDVSEQMIFNNYHAMVFIKFLLKDGDIELTPKIIFDLHNIVTAETLTGDDEGMGGKLRGTNDQIVVCDPISDEVLHSPPDSSLLKDRLQLICDFVNCKTDKEGAYMSPVLRAIITHFMIGYDHPFVEGNGRTARALFYWVMMKNNYWLMEYISISAILKENRGDYLRAYLHTESDENDLTYFIFQQLETIKDAVTGFYDHMHRQVEKEAETYKMFKNSNIKKQLNRRQIVAIRHALDNAGYIYTVGSHANAHEVSKVVSRKDLNALAEFGLLNKLKRGREYVYTAPNDLSARIKEAN